MNIETAVSPLEARTRRFYDWELRGRGWRTYDDPVVLEPPFRPFSGYFAPLRAVHDDARKPTFRSSVWDRLLGKAQPKPAVPEENGEADDLPPAPSAEAPQSEVEILVPADVKLDPATSETWLRSIASGAGPISFELLGTAGRAHVRLAGDAPDLGRATALLLSFVPAASTRAAAPVAEAIGIGAMATVELALAREFMLPLAALPPRVDLYSGLVGSLSRAHARETIVMQVIFEEARFPWSQSVLRAVRSPDGSPFFLDAPHLTQLAEEKCAEPLYAVVVRVCACASDDERAWDLLRGTVAALAPLGAPGRNQLVPVSGSGADILLEDIIARRTRRSGMLLSLSELTSLVHLPGDAVRSPALVRTPEPEKRLPKEVRGDDGVVLGTGVHRGEDALVRIATEARLQHTYLVGASGTGKSTLLQQLVLQDISAGAGVGVVDPHGDLVEEILARVPEERVGDVVVFDPSDPEQVVGWNILGAHSDVEKDLLASDLVAVFRRLSTSWGDQMNVVLANAVMAFLESSRGGTLSDLRKFLLDDTYRTAFLSTVTDDHVRSFWEQEFALLAGKRPQAPILTRLDTFLRSKLIREAVTETRHPLNFRELIDSGAIFLAKLSQGAIGEENAALLGSLLVSKFHQVSLSRQDTALEDRRPFFLYLDEFQSFATPSMSSLFSGVRKYRLALTVAHQDLYQLHAHLPEVERAVLANAYTRVLFRVSDEDARKLEKGITGFTSEDLANLPRGQAICRVGTKDNAFMLRTEKLPELDPAELRERADRVRRQSFDRFGRPRGSREPSARHQPSPVHRQEPESAPKQEAFIPDQLPGRGGAVHKYIQGLITEWGRAQGFRPEIEMQLPDGKRVDVALVRGDLRIACEIAGVSTVDQEVRNIAKCIAAPFTHICAISLDRSFLAEVEDATEASFSADERQRISVLSPEEFLAFLQTQQIPAAESRVRGYTVQVRGRPTQPPEDGRRVIADVMLRSARKLRSGSIAKEQE